MSRQCNPTLDSLAGQAMVSSLDIPERRLSKAELSRLPIEDQILYTTRNPMTEQEKWDELEHEHDVAAHELGNELTWSSPMFQDGPDDYLDDID